ncbi:Bulb-type lectin domain [Sesbania bispinosa]|nr:Bulb-type lectin domain [Sesbania bispinosa]
MDQVYSSMASFFLHFLLCSLILLPFRVQSQTRSNIAVGGSFNAKTSSSPWLVSPSGDFAFGFLPLLGTDLFLLSIWYAKIPDKTIVWYANGDNPAPKDSKVELTVDGLVLTSPNGEQLWKTEGLSVRVSHGVFNDTGNFVLEDGNSNTVWETFKNPKDTLLPSQVLGKGGKLSSRLKETNFSKGRFELLLQNDGNLVMHSINLPSEYVNENYYKSGTTRSNTSSPGTQLVFDRSGDLYVLRENNEKFNVSEGGRVSTNQFYLRASLNFDGVFTLYQHPKNSSTENGGWSPVWSQPDNICTDLLVNAGSGVCGYNSFCTLGDNQRPICQCPKRYSLVDPTDPYGSCKPDFPLGCAEDELSNKKDLYDFEVLINTDWPLSDSVLLKPFTEEQCRQSCMEDCMCSVAIFRLGDSCWKKKLPLSNGKVDASLDGAKAFLKVRKDNSSLVFPPGPIIVKKNRNTMVLVGSVLLSSSAVLNIVLMGALCFSTSLIFHKKKCHLELPRYQLLVLSEEAFYLKKIANRGSYMKEATFDHQFV